MIGSHLTYEVRLARIDDLRRDAEDRRRAIHATRDPDRSLSTMGHWHRPPLSRRRLRALGMLGPRRPARA